ncbi:hypothetical protein D3C83_241640 [compost metagenome]
MPERHDRMSAGGQDAIKMLQSLDTPAERLAEHVDERVAERGNRCRLRTFDR